MEVSQIRVVRVLRIISRLLVAGLTRKFRVDNQIKLSWFVKEIRLLIQV